MQLCGKCRSRYPFETVVPCLSCDSDSPNIPCSDKLVGIAEKLLDIGIKLISANCDIFNLVNISGMRIQIIIELGDLYPDTMFEGLLEKGWITFEYHTAHNGTLGPKYKGISYSQQLLYDFDDADSVLTLAINDFEAWLDSIDADAYPSILTLARYM